MHSKNLTDDLKYFSNLVSGEDQMIERSSISLHHSHISGKFVKHSHQKSIPPCSLKSAAAALISGKAILKQAKIFDDIYDWVYKECNIYHRIGALTIYDISIRIAYAYNIYPTDVYLHAGATEGAGTMPSINVNQPKVPLTKFPKELQSLGALGLENFLCIYKDDLMAGKQGH